MLSLLTWTTMSTLVVAPLPQVVTTLPPPVTATVSGQNDPRADNATQADASVVTMGATPADASSPDVAPPASQSTEPSQQQTAEQADIVVTGQRRSSAGDPLQAINEQSFEATQAVDDAVVAPIALAYKKTAPKPFRKGVHNILYNLREPVVFVNFLLQHKIGKAAETVARFGINTTVGLLGAFDVAKRKPFKLPRRGNGFADTLGFYGVPPGPFMFLPLVGPTTVRDLIGGGVDRLVLPIAFGKRVTKPEFVIPAAVLGVLDHRAEFDETLKTLHDDAADPYANTRAFYLSRRQAEIDHLRGRDTGNSTPMSVAPTAPIDERGREVRPQP